MTDATLSLTCGYRFSGRGDLTGTGLTAGAVIQERFLKAALANGTGAGQVNLVAVAERTIAASDFVEFDLYGGLILDNAGATLASLKALDGAAALFATLRGFQF